MASPLSPNTDPNVGAGQSGGFASLPEAIAQPPAPPTPDEVRTADEELDDITAFGMVLSDAASCVNYVSGKGLVPLNIEASDDLYRGVVPPRQWADGRPRASLAMHVVLNAIEKLMPKLYLALFGNGKKEPFICTPRGKTTPEAARANATLLHWAMKQAKTKEEMRIALKTALQYGFFIGQWGWESKEQKEKVYKKQADGSMKGTWKVDDIEIPFFEALDMKYVLFDPNLKRQDVQANANGARFIIRQHYTNGYGLAAYRKNPQYKNIPTDEELKFFLATKSEPTTDELAQIKRPIWREFQAALEQDQTASDPMMQPLEILEWVSRDRVICILQRKLTIRNGGNEFGRLNFNSCAFVDVLGSAWGMGAAKLLMGEQRLQQGVANNWIDSLALVLNPVFQLIKGIGPGTQTIPLSPGKIISEVGELKPLIVPDVTKPAMEALATSDQRANEKVGVTGGSNMPNQAMRTAEGVQAFAGDMIERLQYWLEIFTNLVYIPVLEAFLEIIREHLTPEQIQSILTAEQGKAWEGDIADVYNAKIGVEVIGGANMLGKFAAAQLAPMFVNMLASIEGQLETQGVFFDYADFVKDVADLLGWDAGVYFHGMTDEMKKNVQQKNAALQRVQGDMALEAQKYQNDIGRIDAKGYTQAGVGLVRQAGKSNMDEAQQLMENMETMQGGTNGGTEQPAAG